MHNSIAILTMEKKFVEILGNAVLNGITVEKSYTQDSYSVVDLMNPKIVNDASLAILGERAIKAHAQYVDRKFGKPAENSEKSRRLKETVELLEAIYNFRKEEAEKLEAKKEIDAMKKSRIKIIEAANEKSEIDRINNMTQEERNRELERLKGL